MEKKKKRHKVVKKLRNKYRLVILNDDTFEEKLSFKLSRLNVFVLVGFVTIFLIVSTGLLIAFTPIREYIPGYSSTKLKREIAELSFATDSIRQQLLYNDHYLQNIKNVIEGKEPVDFSEEQNRDSSGIGTVDFNISKEDSAFRSEIEVEERYNILKNQEQKTSSLSSAVFFAPVKGIISSSFDIKTKHYGIDIIASKNEPIKTTLDGTVIFSEWTSETGYVISVQHNDNIISIYKHNSALLKKQGDLVKAGEVIAIIGNSGKLSTGPHLHFELWYKGNAVNPENFIAF